MARRRRVGKAHPRLFKYLTLFGATLGVVSSTTFAAVMGIDAAKGDLITDNLREYTASFSSEGSIISKKTYKRGEQLEIPENPEHEIDGESNYFFIGWDTNGNGIPDIVPQRAYYSFDAEAVYFRTGKFDMNFLDLLNMDLEDLLKLLQDLNIDWEQFMSLFNIDPETLMQWLMGQTVLTYTTDPAPSEYPTYFRSTSYGDFDYAKKSFKNPDYYDSSLISANSVNPLSYTAYKLKKLDDAGLLPYNFGFTNYDITFNAVEDYYPVPDCESSNDMGEIVDSDAHYLKEPNNNHYRTSAAYCPAFGYIIDMFNAIPLTGAVGRDEREYYKYALQHYTEVPSEYHAVLDEIICDPANDWYEEEINQVDAIAAYVSGLGQCSLFNDEGGVDVSSYLNSQKKSKDPVMDLINNKKGSDLDFNTTAVMLFRRLRIPARLVKGYVSIGSQRGENAISLFNQHYWCEIYVKGTGWMICDCMDMSAVLGTNPYAGLDQQNTPLKNDHVLERITVTPPRNVTPFQGDSLPTAGGYVTAYFSDGSTTKINLSSSSLKITGYNKDQLGEQDIEVSYTYEGVTKTGGFTVTVIKNDATLVRVVWNTEQAQKSYYLGEAFSKEKVTVMGYFKNDPDDSNEEEIMRDLTDKIQVVSGDTSVLGTFNAILSVTDKKVTFNTTYQYTVVERNPISLQIITPPTKAQYFVGEQLDVSGLVIRVEYKNGSIVDTPFEGLAKYVDSDSAEFLIVGTDPGATQFNVVNDHQEVQVRKYNSELDQYFYDTFEVKVVKNDMESYEAIDFNQEYSVGEYFDVDDFKSDGYIVAHMENGYQVKVSESDYEDSNYDICYKTTFTVDAPTLDVATNTKSVVVHFDYNGVTYDIPVPITVKSYSTDDFVFSEKCGITAGPGATGFANEELFTFTTSHVGTMYFRNTSYQEYTPKGWSVNSDLYNYEPNAGSYHANSFVYDKASQVYNTEPVSITYSRAVPHGVIPSYSNSSGFDNYELENDASVGTTKSYNFVNCELTYENVARLSSSYIPYTGANATYASTYANNQTYQYLGDGSNAYDLIDSYIAQPGHDYYYSYGDIYGMIYTINQVKEDLYNDFVFNPGFTYSRSDVDPMRSFFTQGVGGSKEFATAATLILRHLNYPARYVTGFGAYSSGGTTSVTTRNLHAWCEVYFQGAGWMIVDPTYFDTGITRGTVGQYGAGFGGGGLYNFDKPSCTGIVSITYDYSSQFEEDTSVPENDPYRWYTVYDDRDHTRIYTIALEEGSEALPSYLEYRIVFSWYRNEEYLGNYDSIGQVPTVSYGQYRLVPHLEIYDKASGTYVTSEHNYVLKDGTEDIQFFIQPALIYVYVMGTKDSYSMNGAGTITLTTTGSNPDITYSLIIPENLPESEKELYSNLPSTIQLIITGYFEYTGEGGTIVIDFANIEIEPNDYSYSGQYQWDHYNVIAIPYYGEVVITP